MDASAEDREVVFVVRGQRFTVLRSKLQVQSPLRVLCGISWLGFTQWVGWVQAYPESLLAKLADNEDDGVMAEGANVIRLDRDPTLFSHVLQLFVDKPVAQPTLYEELDFYGLPPSSIMLPASMAADICSRPGESVVSSIIDQMAVLMHETLSNDEGRSFHSSRWSTAHFLPDQATQRPSMERGAGPFEAPFGVQHQSRFSSIFHPATSRDTPPFSGVCRQD
jgi:hypothetical protein